MSTFHAYILTIFQSAFLFVAMAIVSNLGLFGLAMYLVIVVAVFQLGLAIIDTSIKQQRIEYSNRYNKYK